MLNASAQFCESGAPPVRNAGLGLERGMQDPTPATRDDEERTERARQRRSRSGSCCREPVDLVPADMALRASGNPNAMNAHLFIKVSVRFCAGRGNSHRNGGQITQH